MRIADPLRSGVSPVRMMACHNLSLRNGGRTASAVNEPIRNVYIPIKCVCIPCDNQLWRTAFDGRMHGGGTRRVCFASSVTSQSVLHYANRLFAIIFYATALDLFFMPTLHTFIRSGEFFSLLVLHIWFSSD